VNLCATYNKEGFNMLATLLIEVKHDCLKKNV